jgi:RNA polymerase sigma-70 factor (ECF subfamily)
MPEINLEKLEDARLVALYFTGDESALNILVARHLPAVYGFIYNYVKTAADAEDISQEVFVKVWKNLRKFNAQKNFRVWVIRIAKNTIIDFFRKQKALPFAAFDRANGENILAATLASSELSPLEKLNVKSLAQELQAAVSRLAPKYRAVIDLHHRQSLTFQEISEFLHESINTVKSRYRRALAVLKKILPEN